MKIRKISVIALICILYVIVGCIKNDERTYIYEPIDNVTYALHIKKLKYHSDIKAVFLYFELVIENKSNKKFFLDIAKIQAILNGALSSETYYDSLASVMPEKEILKRGQSEYRLYFAFPESLKDEEIKEFRVTNFGLDTESKS